MTFAFIATHRGMWPAGWFARRSVSCAQVSMPGELAHRVPERGPTNNCWPGCEPASTPENRTHGGQDVSDASPGQSRRIR